MCTEEAGLLKDFLYEAIFIPEGVEPPPRDIVEQPELRIYYEYFGRCEADLCLLAEADGHVVGAVWTRIMDDYGHVDDETPSFAISLIPEYRGKGIAAQLLNRVCEDARADGYEYVEAYPSIQTQDSLAFTGPVRLYEKAGFTEFSRTGSTILNIIYNYDCGYDIFLSKEPDHGNSILRRGNKYEQRGYSLWLI